MRFYPSRFGLGLALGLALSITSAILLTLAFPPYNLGLLILVGFIPMLVAQYYLLPGRLSSLAPAITIGGWLGAFLIPIFANKSYYMAAIPLLVGVIVLFADKNKRAFHARTVWRWFVLEGVLSWVGIEMLRSLIPALGTWAFVGYPLWNHPWLLQPLSVIGIYGLDLLIMLCNYVLALVALRLFPRKWRWEDVPEVNPASTRRWLGVLIILLAGWVGLSLVLYSSSRRMSSARVAAIQPNLPRAAHRDTVTLPEQRLAILTTLTRAAVVQGAQLAVWPEMALGFDPRLEYTQELQALAAETQTYIVIGYALDNAQGFRNEATILAPSGEFLGVYGKNHPMISSGEPKTTSAGRYPVYDAPFGRLGTIICFDAGFTDASRRLGRQGVQLIADPSLFGGSMAELPYTQIIFRAIENRTAFVMADVAYNSAIVDPYGRVLKLVITPQGSQTILVADVPLGSGKTLYSRLGDWLGWLSLVGLVFFSVYMTLTLSRASHLSFPDRAPGNGG